MEFLKSINIFNSKTCKLPYAKECIGAYQLMALVVIVILVYYYAMRLYHGSDNEVIKNDFMNRKVFECDVLENCCSWWPISHFIFFMILGFLYPACAIPLLTLGVVWELFEAGSSYVLNKEVHQAVVPGGITDKYEYSQNWWAGSAKDVVMNTSGFFVGVLFAKIIRG